MLVRIQAFPWAHRRQVVVERAARGYSLCSARNGGRIARLRPTGEGDKVQVLWWNGERWAAPGPFGIPTMTLERALGFIADEPAFWIHT